MQAGVKSGIGSIVAAMALLLTASAAQGAWHQLAGPVSPTASGDSSNPTFAGVGGTPYVAWGGSSVASPGFSAIWVARLAGDGSSWVQVPGPNEAITSSGASMPSIADVGGRPYLAYTFLLPNRYVSVSRLNAAGTAWENVGSLNHDGNMSATQPSLTTVGGVPYVAWAEASNPNFEIRVARLKPSGTGWDELVGSNASSPINRSGSSEAQNPSMADVGGVPYVAWSENDGTNTEIRVARLSPDEQHWVRLEPPADNITWGGINVSRSQNADHPSLIGIGGVPYVAWEESDGTNTEIRVARLTASGAWEQVGGGSSPINEDPAANASDPSIANFDGVPFVSWVEAGKVRVAKLGADGSSWEKVADSASPINQDPAKPAAAPGLANVGGLPYVAWQEPDTTNRNRIHVSQLEPDFQSQAVSPGATTATLSATWRTYGFGFPIGFDYGASLENSTTPVAAPTGEDSPTVTQTVSGLAASSVYQFRSFALPPFASKLLAPNSTVFQTTAPGGPDTTPPQTKIVKEPPSRLKKSKAKYKFISTEQNSTFVCKFDKKKPKPCDAGKFKAKHLDDGKHKFRVYAVDPAGNADRTPAKDKFKVV